MLRELGMAKQAVRRKPRRSALVVMLALPLAGLLGIPGVAHAAPASTSKTGHVNYSKAWTFRSAPLKLCVQFVASGKITYAETAAPTGRGVDYEYNAITVRAPELTATTEHLKGKTCSGTTKVSSVTITQAWGGYSCGFNPSISASFPWGVGISFWPSCSNRDQADYSQPFGSGYHYIQDNTGDDFSYGKYTNALPTSNTPPCYGVYVTGNVRVGNHSDTYRGGANSVCLQKLGV
jgi:hypothetical protein